MAEEDLPTEDLVEEALEDISEEALIGASDAGTMDEEEAAGEVQRAVAGRRAMARKYVQSVRKRNPDATPAELIPMLERHYLGAISAAGAALTVGKVAAELGISLIPGGSSATKGGKVAGKAAFKAASQGLLKKAAKEGSTHALARLVPAGDKQVQFEVTALFALALAEIHDLDLDQQQSAALVHGLTNGDASPAEIASLAASAASGSAAKPKGTAWAATLADGIPGETAQGFIRSLADSDEMKRMNGQLSPKQRGAADAGAQALVASTQRFVFGRAVVDAARTAFGEAPEDFPTYLALPTPAELAEPQEKAISAMEEVAEAVGDKPESRAMALKAGLGAAADSVSRPFRRVDLDGDGVVDEPSALTAVKNAGKGVSSMTTAVSNKLTSPLKGKWKRPGKAGSAEAAAVDESDEHLEASALAPEEDGALPQDE